MPVGSAKFGLFAAAGSDTEVFGWEWIETVLVASSNSSIVHDGGPWSDYAALKCVGSVRGSYSGNTGTFYLGTSYGSYTNASQYNLMQLGHHASNNAHTSALRNTGWGGQEPVFCSGSTADAFSPFVLEFFNPNDTDSYKNYSLQTAIVTEGSSTYDTKRYQLAMGAAEQTGVLTRIRIESNTGWEPNSRSDLYGLKMDTSKVTDH
jgi:hypothetical protein